MPHLDSFVLVMTHSHALDLEIVDAALAQSQRCLYRPDWQRDEARAL